MTGVDSIRDRRRIAAMTNRRDAAIRDTERLIETAKELHAALRATEAVYRKTLKKLKQDTSISEVLSDVQAENARKELNDALEALEHGRHQARLALTAAGLEEGMAVSDTGRAWGFSRQLADRYAKEARGEE